MIKAPCKECPRKGCGPFHDQCEEYKQFRAQLEAENAAEREHKEKLYGRSVTLTSESKRNIKKSEIYYNKRRG